MESTGTRSDLIDFGKKLHEHGYLTASGGNLSVRDGGNVLITPTQVPYYQLDATEISLVSQEGILLSGPEPSRELLTHLGIFEARRDIHAVIHAHPVSALACALKFEDNPFPPLTVDFVVKLGEVAVVDFFMPGSKEMADIISENFARSNAVVINHHGLFVGAATLGKAFEMVEQIEATAKLNLATGGAAVGLSLDEVSEIRLHYFSG